MTNNQDSSTSAIPGAWKSKYDDPNVGIAKGLKSKGKSNSWIAFFMGIDESSVRTLLAVEEDNPKSYPWKQRDNGCIIQTTKDQEDNEVSIFTQTVKAWNQKIQDEEKPKASGEVVYFEQPTRPGKFRRMMDWLQSV